MGGWVYDENDVDFMMNFKNFLPPAGKDSTKLDTVLKKGSSISKTYNFTRGSKI